MLFLLRMCELPIASEGAVSVGFQIHKELPNLGTRPSFGLTFPPLAASLVPNDCL